LLEFVFCLARQSPDGQGLLIHEVSRSHTPTHHSRYDSSGRVISSSQSPLPFVRVINVIYLCSWRRTPEDLSLQQHYCDNLKLLTTMITRPMFA